ncbi:MAG: hypothetical protein ACI8PZ_006291 [Myxococcota bacterium]
MEFHGMHEADVGALRHLADVHRGARTWEVDVGAIARSVERHPWVREATAEISWPDTVRVRVQERQPVALLLRGERLHYVDQEGVAFLQADLNQADLPVISGIDDDLAALHPSLPSLAVRSALHLAATLDTEGLVPLDQLSGIHFSRSRGLTVTAGRSRLVFGLDDLDRQTARLEDLLDRGVVRLDVPFHVDLAPKTVAIIRALDAPGDG